MGVVTVTIFFPSFWVLDMESSNLDRRSRAGNSSRQAPVFLVGMSGKVSHRLGSLLSQLNPDVEQKVYIGVIVSQLSGADG
jgi:hypothetical protein